MHVKSLGYVVVESTRPQEWERFLTQVAGAMRAGDAADGAAQYRIDKRPFRFRIVKGKADRLIASAFEVDSEQEWRWARGHCRHRTVCN